MDPPETATDGQNSVQMMVGKFDRFISKWNVFNRVQLRLNGAVKRAKKAGVSDHQLAFVLGEIEGELLRECNSTFRGAVEIRSLEELNNLRKHEVSHLSKSLKKYFIK